MRFVYGRSATFRRNVRDRRPLVSTRYSVAVLTSSSRAVKSRELSAVIGTRVQDAESLVRAHSSAPPGWNPTGRAVIMTLRAARDGRVARLHVEAVRVDRVRVFPWREQRAHAVAQRLGTEREDGEERRRSGAERRRTPARWYGRPRDVRRGPRARAPRPCRAHVRPSPRTSARRARPRPRTTARPRDVGSCSSSTAPPVRRAAAAATA